MTRRARLAVAAVLAAGLVGCGGAALVPPSPSAATSRPTGASLAPSSSAAAPWSELAWSRPNPVPDEATILDVVEWRGSYVATGQAIVDGRRVGVAIASADGLSWHRTAILPGNASLVPTATRVVALASTSFDRPSGVDGWTSMDGRSWQRDDALALADATLTRSVARGNTMVAVGADASGRPAVWRSFDGGAWARGEPPSPHAIVRGLETVADGFIAVGREGEPDVASGGVGAPGVGLPAAWWSADGRAWTALQVEGVPAAGAQLLEVFTVGDGYFAIGSDSTTPGASTRTALLWTSSDGHAWKLAGAPPHGPGMLGANGQRAAVLAYAGPAANPEAWSSRDGRQWTRVSFTGDVADIPVVQQSVGMSGHIDRVFVLSRAIVVIGQVVTQQNGHQAVWLAAASP